MTSFKKINPKKDSCDAWEQDSKLKTSREYRKICVFCHYSLFARCWLSEALQKNPLVLSALRENYDAKQEIHKELMKDGEI